MPSSQRAIRRDAVDDPEAIHRFEPFG
ncbi:MAG: hypothetical protein RLZZ467_1012, partial [Gemmatimonadota bacterium]